VRQVRAGMALMALFAALWTVVELLAARLSRPYHPAQVVFTRYAVHLAFMALVWGWRGPASLWRTRRPLAQLGRSLLMACMPACFVLAARAGAAPATTLALFAATPLLLVGLARLLLGERPRWPAWAAAAAAGLGGAALLRPAPPTPLQAVLALAMAASFGLYVVATRALAGEGTRVNLFWTAAGVAAALAPLQPRVWSTPSPRDAAVLAGVGLLGWATLWALDRATARAPVALLAPAAGLQAAFAAAGGAAGGAGRGLASAAGLAALLLAAATLWAVPERALGTPSRPAPEPTP
jgi:drug/metabolite transporter (DMT)-like permease